MDEQEIGFDIKDYYQIEAEHQVEIVREIILEIRKYLPEYKGDRCATLKELDEFLSKKYNAKKAVLDDINKCTRTKFRYKKKYRTVNFVGEGMVTEEDYYASYIIEHENCINPFEDKDCFFYDIFLTIGSKDGIHFTSFNNGGYSDDIIEELGILSGQCLKERNS